MRRRVLAYYLFFLLSVFAPLYSYGSYTIVNGKWTEDSTLPTMSCSEHNELATQCMERRDWDEALRNFLVIINHFEQTPFYNDALFNSAACYFNLSEYDLADHQFSYYLTQKGNIKHFEEVFEYKFLIAEKYREGARRHMFGYHKMPKWCTGRGEALKLYDEIVVSLPNKDLAARALFSKSLLLKSKKEYRESIDALQTLARRFPKHPLAAESYLQISLIYLEQSEIEAQNPDILALAQINLRRFKKAFPGDERIEKADSDLLAMKEFFANSLYETGRFYERKKKPHAAAIYYNDAIKKYPETLAASKSKERLCYFKDSGIETHFVQNQKNSKNFFSKIFS